MKNDKAQNEDVWLAQAYEESRYHRRYHHWLFGLSTGLYIWLLKQQFESDGSAMVKAIKVATYRISESGLFDLEYRDIFSLVVGVSLLYILPCIVVCDMLRHHVAFAKASEFVAVTHGGKEYDGKKRPMNAIGFSKFETEKLKKIQTIRCALFNVACAKSIVVCYLFIFLPLLLIHWVIEKIDVKKSSESDSIPDCVYYIIGEGHWKFIWTIELFVALNAGALLYQNGISFLPLLVPGIVVAGVVVGKLLNIALNHEINSSTVSPK